MSFEKRKLKIIEKVVHLEDESILSQIEELILDETDFWEKLSAEDKAKIKKGIQQHENGNRILFEDFVKSLKR